MIVPLPALPPLFTALLYLIVGIFVLSRVQAGKKKVAYSLWLFTTVYWQMGWAIAFSLKDPTWISFIIRLNYSGIVFIPIAFYRLFIAFLDAQYDYRWLKLCYGLGIIFSTACWVDHWMVGGTFHYPWGFYARAGRYHPFYILFLTLIVCRILVLLFQTKPGTPAGKSDPKQLNLLRWAFVLYLPASFDFAINYGLRCYPIGFIFTLISLGFVSYAIVKHQLFNIRLIIQKTLVYSAATLSLTAVYVGVLVFITKILEGWVGAPNIYSSAVAAIVIALLFHPVRSRIQIWMDRHFPRESLNQAILREATGRFVHEIKRPLTNISLPAELSMADLRDLQEGRRPMTEVLPKVQQRLQYILNQTAAAADKIEAIREFSETQGKHLVELNLAQIISKSVSSERDFLDRFQIQLKLDIDADVLTVRGHAKQLEIVFTNLLKNAIESLETMNAGAERLIRIFAYMSKEVVVIDMEDSGPGISQDIVRHLFEPYFTTKGVHGMGMGLFLCRQIVQSHGGIIEVENLSGQGCRFRVKLPMVIHG